MLDRVSRRVLSLMLLTFLLTLMPIADLGGIAARPTMVVSEPEKQELLLTGTPHAPITIDGDANFSATALLEGWPGNGSPENPYIIEGLDINPGGGLDYLISITNTRVRFIIRNCNLIGTIEHGLYSTIWGIRLENVVNGKLVKNTCNNNSIGIDLFYADSNTVTNNICISNGESGISLDYYSHSNTVFNNTCTSNGESGIYLVVSSSNIVENNLCNNNMQYGIYLEYSHRNTVTNNICNNNSIGIYLEGSNSNTVTRNTCLSNTEHDIYLVDSDSNTVSNNITGLEFVVLLLGGVLLLLPLYIPELSPVWHIAFAMIQRTRCRLVFWFRKRRGGPDEIIVPLRYRLVSLLRTGGSLNHMVVDELLEADSSDQ
jgi:parallel beta-helix repeat protein